MVTKKHKKEEESEVKAEVPVEVAPPAPPIDNDHVAEGASKFDDATVAANQPAAGVTRVIFRLKDVVVKSREFSEAVHGADFLSIADQFAASNARKILSREDL